MGTRTVMEDFRKHLDIEGIVLDPVELLEYLAGWLTFQGVKIGGVYRHFKGKEYKVKNVVRDADDWKMWRVEYVEITDATHEASRPVEYFLGMHESGVRRFVLVA